MKLNLYMKVFLQNFCKLGRWLEEDQPIITGESHFLFYFITLWMMNFPLKWARNLGASCCWKQNQWLNESMNQWINGSMDQWINESMNQYINGSTGQWINESVNQSINQSINQSVSLSVCLSVCLSVSQSSIGQTVNETVRHWFRDWAGLANNFTT